MRPLPKRQRICFDLGISQLLFELLFFLRKNRDGMLNIEGKLVQQGIKMFEDKQN